MDPQRSGQIDLIRMVIIKTKACFPVRTVRSAARTEIWENAPSYRTTTRSGSQRPLMVFDTRRNEYAAPDKSGFRAGIG
jgi:hypothetical protein